MALPPAHTVDHEPVYVLSFDTAWLHKELNASLADAKTKGQTAEHPWWKYRVGDARGDISTVMQWLDPAKLPVKFHLRRMTYREWQVVTGLNLTDSFAAQCLALQCSLTKIDGAKLELNRGGSESGHLDDGDMERLKTMVGDDGWAELTNQALGVSRSLLESEKKP